MDLHFCPVCCRYTQEREAALIADETRRKAAVVASNKRLVQSLEEQLKIQQARKEAEKAEEQVSCWAVITGCC